MKIFKFLFCFSLLYIPMMQTWADGYYDKACLETCFSTGHDCAYCNYQCYKYYRSCGNPNYDGDTVCPFKNYKNYDEEIDW